MIRRIGVGVYAFALLVGAAAPASAATRTVCASGCSYTNLQAAIDAAVYGDVILLRAGQTYRGHYVLRAKSGSGVIEIRSDASSGLPPAGTRLVPSDRPGGNTSRSLLPRLVGLGDRYKTMPLISTEPGAHGYLLRFLEFDGEAHLGYETLIQIGEDTTVTPPYDITFDRVYIHGDRYRGQKRGITLNARRISVLNSYISDIKAVNADSQAIAGYNGAGPFTIENNFLEAAGENIMFGGSDPAITDLVPSDIVIRRNHLYKPVSWKGAILATPGSVRATAGTSGSLAARTHYFRIVAAMATDTRTAVSLPSAEVSATVGSSGSVTLSWSGVPGADKYRVYRGTSAGSQTVYLETTGTSFVYRGTSELAGSPGSSATKWAVKNSFELKNAARVTVEGNLFENCWAAGQFGYAIVLTPRNGGRAPWTRVQDITFTNNIVRHAAGVVNISGYDDNNPSGRTERITFRNNLFADISHTKYGGTAKALLAGNGAAYLVFDRNTFIHENSSVLYAYGAAMPGLQYTNNISLHHAYGIMGQNSATGTTTLTAFFPGASVRCNVLAGGRASLYPTPNGFPSVADWNASFVDLAGGNYTLRTGSPVALAGCDGIPPGADIAAISAATAGGSAPAPAPTTPTSPANAAPTADAGGPYAAAAGALVSADGTGSSDPEGGALHYRWHWADEILVRAADLPASALRGSEWVRTTAGDAAGAVMILNPDRGASKRSTALAAPGSYVEFTVNAAAGVPYYLWMRLKATANGYGNDSLYLQFNNAVDAQGAAVARIGTTAALPMILEAAYGAGISGWGWTDAVYGGTAAPVYFARSGPQTIRLQAREDGVAWDQLVLSSSAFTRAPGSAKNDLTVLDEDTGTATGVSAAHRYARAGAFPLTLVVTDPAGAAASDSTTVTVTGSSTAPAPSANAAPVADAGGPYAGTAGTAVSVNGTRSTDPEGGTLQYRWYWGDEILVRAADLPSSAVRGSEWVRTPASDASGSYMLLNPDRGAPKRSAALAAPASYVEFTVHAAAGVPYYLWMRLRATADAYGNDSLYLQFSGATDAQGSAVARIGTTSGLPIILEAAYGAGISGWGWTDAVYGGTAAPVYFAQSGPQTIRLQAREDGVAWDQLVLSTAAYTRAPGAAKQDATRLSPTFGSSTGATASHTYPRAGVYPLELIVADPAGATSADTTTVTVR